MDPINISNFIYDSISMCFLVIIFFYLKYFLKPFETGFYCSDHTIGLPFKASTVSNRLLMLIALVLPLAFLVVTELVRTIYMRHKIVSQSTNSSLCLRNKYKIRVTKNRIIELPEQIGNIFINYFNFIFGLIICANLTNIGKKTIGRLRPNFLDVCKPNKDPYESICKSNEQIGYHAKYYVVQGVDFLCTGLKSDVIESRLSFPSGHASTVCYTAVFLVLFINRTWSKRSFSFVAQFFQFLLVSLAFFTGLSRVIDNKHHWSDVLAGSILGTLVALVKFYYLSLFYKRYNYKVKYNLPVTSVDLTLIQDVRESNSNEANPSKRKNNDIKNV